MRTGLWVAVVDPVFAYGVLLDLLAKFGSSVLEPNLNPGLGLIDLESHLLPHEKIRIPSFLKESVQCVELSSGKCGSFSLYLPMGCSIPCCQEMMGCFIAWCHRMVKTCSIPCSLRMVKTYPIPCCQLVLKTCSIPCSHRMV